MAARCCCRLSAPETEHPPNPVCPRVRPAARDMTIRLHLEIVGAVLIILGAAHGLFGRYFGWKEELARVSLLTRQVFRVHCFFIGLLLVLLGACSLFYADALLT